MPWTVYVKTLYRDPFCCDIYVKKEDEGSGFRKRKVFFCPTHASVLVADWVNIIKQELDLARAFDQYMDRMER